MVVSSYGGALGVAEFLSNPSWDQADVTSFLRTFLRGWYTRKIEINPDQHTRFAYLTVTAKSEDDAFGKIQDWVLWAPNYFIKAGASNYGLEYDLIDLLCNSEMPTVFSSVRLLSSFSLLCNSGMPTVYSSGRLLILLLYACSPGFVQGTVAAGLLVCQFTS